MRASLLRPALSLEVALPEEEAGGLYSLLNTLEGRAAARRLRGERLEREEVALRRGERPEVEGRRHVDVDAVALLVEDAEVVPARARRS